MGLSLPKSNLIFLKKCLDKWVHFTPIMPITGGMGTVIFSIVGIVLVAGGIMLITGYQRRRRA